MAPPTYADLGKNARDLFAKGYHYGLFKLELKSKAKNGMEFTAGGNHNFESGKVSGNLETKYKWSDIGLTFTEKWHTDNVLSSEVTIEDQLLEGLKLSFDTSFAPQTGKKSGKIKTAYKTDIVNLGCDVDFDFAGPLVHGAAVIGYRGYLAGYQMSFDTAKSKLSKNNFAIGYSNDEFTLHTNVNDGQEFAGSIHQKISDVLETGVTLSWNATSNATRFAIGSKYKLDNDTAINTKVNNSGQLGLGYTTNIREGVKATLSALLDCKHLNQGGHKIGFCLELSA